MDIDPARGNSPRRIPLLGIHRRSPKAQPPDLPFRCRPDRSVLIFQNTAEFFAGLLEVDGCLPSGAQRAQFDDRGPARCINHTLVQPGRDQIPNGSGAFENPVRLQPGNPKDARVGGRHQHIAVWRKSPDRVGETLHLLELWAGTGRSRHPEEARGSTRVDRTGKTGDTLYVRVQIALCTEPR